MNFVEFQVKGFASPEFLKIKSLCNEKEIKHFRDGERFICFVLEEKRIMDRIFYQVEDIEHTMIGLIDSKHFHRITELKNNSKRFTLLKQQLRILDKI